MVLWTSWSSPSGNHLLQKSFAPVKQCKGWLWLPQIRSGGSSTTMSVTYTVRDTKQLWIWQPSQMWAQLMRAHVCMSVWHTILVFMSTEPRGLSSGTGWHSLLSILVTHSAWSHLSLACVWLGKLTSKHISGYVFVRHSLLPLGNFFPWDTDTHFQLEANSWSVPFLSQERSSWCSLSKPNSNLELCSRHRSECYQKHLGTRGFYFCSFMYLSHYSN